MFIIYLDAPTIMWVLVYNAGLVFGWTLPVFTGAKINSLALAGSLCSQLYSWHYFKCSWQAVSAAQEQVIIMLGCDPTAQFLV